jgi:hypothetical protein
MLNATSGHHGTFEVQGNIVNTNRSAQVGTFDLFFHTVFAGTPTQLINSHPFNGTYTT